ncbi:hypothetical protein FOZ61_010024 [Perkinsus olseni]|uniref:Uncharacterized protein n=1 Tax=Perkinsus olseni TaxID=32597 RepID=A0A7J6KX65_PEROL|nr:hypothetical protein FOZ61_010024 [Perkinsus olseni]
MNLPASLVCIAVFLVTSCGGEVIRMKIFTQQTKPWAPWRRIVTPLKVDTQDLYAVIDTGSPYTQLIWKKWYESSPERRCDELFYKCYGCNPSPIELKAAKKITFVDKTSVTIFPYAGDFYFYGVTVEDIVFGVVMDASDGPWAALGLGPQATSPPFPRFVDQLVDAELMMSYASTVLFLRSIYRLGAPHQGSLSLVVTILPVVFDTGSSFISFPERLRSQVLDLLSTAGTKKVEVTKEDGPWAAIGLGPQSIEPPYKRFVDQLRSQHLIDSGVFSLYLSSGGAPKDCDDKDHLPTMRFTMQGLVGKYDVTIAVPPAAYVVEILPTACNVGIGFLGDWIIGLPAFVGNYYSVDYVGAKIGVAKAYKETLEKLNWEVHHFTLPNMNAQAVSHSLAITCEFSKTIDHEDLDLQQIQLGFGRDISAVEALAIQRLKGWSLEQWNSVFENVDAVCTPTLPLTSIPIPKNAKSHGVFYPQLGVRMMRYAWPTNLLGFPSISVPVGYDAHGMPIGFQVRNPNLGYARVLAAIKMLQDLLHMQLQLGWASTAKI